MTSSKSTKTPSTSTQPTSTSTSTKAPPASTSTRVTSRAMAPKQMSPLQQVGAAAETLAANAYVARGCRVVARNVLIASAEIDLIVKDGDIVVFVEVRRRNHRTDALESVTTAKQRKLIRGASAWLARHAPSARARFDVVVVVGDGVEVVVDAFSA